MSDSLTFAFPPEVADELVERVAARAAALVLAELEGRDGDPWLDVDGAARHLGCPRSRVYDLTRRGVENPLPCHRDGRRLYFRASELDAWREEVAR